MLTAFAMLLISSLNQKRALIEFSNDQTDSSKAWKGKKKYVAT